MKVNHLFFASLIAITFAQTGCGGANATNFAATQSNLKPLKNGFAYQGWAIINGTPRSFGKFNADSSGNLVDVKGNPMAAFALNPSFAAATKLVITIEPNSGPNDTPSATHLIAGPVTNGVATLTTTDSAAFGTDFVSSTGSFLLATPTAPQPPANPTSGVWFLTLPGPAAALTLPTLPSGWTYEGWAVIGGVPLSTGKFTSASGADQSGQFSGPNPGPPFPGEDFLNNAPAGVTLPTNLEGDPIVITVEPSPDDSSSPYSIKPLTGSAPVGTGPKVSVNMANPGTSGLPTMTITVKS